MNKNKNITENKIRVLLDRWYEGLTMPAEQQVLVDYFSDTDEADLAADLRADAPMFRAIGLREVPPAAANTGVTEPMMSRRRRKVPGFWIGLSAAAVVAVILATSLLHTSSLDGTTTRIATDDLPADATPKTTDSVIEVEPAQLPKHDVVATVTNVAESAPQPSHENPSKVDDDIVFVEDPEAASRILNRIERRISGIERQAGGLVRKAFVGAPDVDFIISNAPSLDQMMQRTFERLN